MSASAPQLLPGARSSEPPVAVEAADRVLGYLLFHRALLDDGARADEHRALLERYLSLVTELRDGVHIVIEDPQQKATALLFELVLDQAFDPWEIDLVRFTQAYLERLKGEAPIDFAVSGRLLYMAWNILYLQSRQLLEHRDELLPGPSGPLDGSAEPIDALGAEGGYLEELTTPEAVTVTSAILDGPVPSGLEAMIRHSETRPVSLLELVQAFGQAEVEARRTLQIEALRARLREEQRSPPEVLVHGDVPARDLSDTWNACRAHPVGESFPFLSLWRAAEGRDRLVAVFLALLFLARENVVAMDQEHLGDGPLLLTRRAEARPTLTPKEAA
jgi:segregation and condensation protein A